MSMYSEQHGYQEMPLNPALGDIEDIQERNERKLDTSNGSEQQSLDELTHKREQLEYQMSKVPDMDKPLLEEEISQLDAKIAALEGVDSTDLKLAA